jgi:hypothetical protein
LSRTVSQAWGKTGTRNLLAPFQHSVHAFCMPQPALDLGAGLLPKLFRANARPDAAVLGLRHHRYQDEGQNDHHRFSHDPYPVSIRRRARWSSLFAVRPRKRLKR